MLPVDSFLDEFAKISQSKRDDELFRKLKKEAPVEVRKSEEAKEYGGAYFDTISKHIGISDKRFDSLAHEIGHAKNHETIWGRLIQSVPSTLAFKLAPWAGAAAGIALAYGKKWPMLIPAAAVTPILLAEALATRTGGEVLKKVKASPEEVEKYRANLRRSFSTYLQTPLAATATGSAAYILTQALKNAPKRL